MARVALGIGSALAVSLLVACSGQSTDGAAEADGPVAVDVAVNDGEVADDRGLAAEAESVAADDGESVPSSDDEPGVDDGESVPSDGAEQADRVERADDAEPVAGEERAEETAESALAGDAQSAEAEEPAENAEPSANGQAAPAEGLSTVDRLERNAEEFEYTIGTPGGALIESTVSEPLTFNLALANDASSSGLLGYLFEGLTETSWLTDRVQPALAQSWERSDDGLTWTFHLRRDVTWHDGEPFTAHDVDFTFNRIIFNHDIGASSRSTFEFLYLDDNGDWQEAHMEVEALDDHTVEFALPVPFAPFLRSMGTAIYPRHILEPHVDDGTFEQTWDIDTDPAEIIGTGPFTIAGYEPGVRVVLARNPDYWLTDAEGSRLPYLDGIVHNIVEDTEAELAAFMAGESDVHSLPGEQYAQLNPLQTEGGFTIHQRGPNFGTTFLTFNLNPGQSPDSGEPYVAAHKLDWFANVAFRRAVAHSIDKGAIIDGVQHGLGYPQWSSVSPAAGDFHNGDVRTYPHDLDRANEILDGLGWTDTDGDGVREDSHGNAIEFRLVTNIGNSERQEITGIIQRGMEAVGLKVEYEAIEFGELVDQLVDTYDWEAVVIGLTGSSDPYSGIDVWHSTGDLHLWHPNQPEPASQWEAEIDELYISASQELDHEARVGLYHQAQAIAAENVPLIYTTLRERLTATRDVFANTTPTLYGLWDIRYLYRSDALTDGLDGQEISARGRRAA